MESHRLIEFFSESLEIKLKVKEAGRSTEMKSVISDTNREMGETLCGLKIDLKVNLLYS